MKELDKLRSQIDRIDEEIIFLIKKRMGIVRVIGEIKKKNALPILDKKRKEEILKIKVQIAKELNLSKEFVENLFSLIHDEGVRIQKK